MTDLVNNNNWIFSKGGLLYYRPLILYLCFSLCRNQCSVRHRTPYNSLCHQRRRVVEPVAAHIFWYPCLLYWDFIEEMFRKLFFSTNLSWYWTSCFWSSWSLNDSCKFDYKYKFVQCSSIHFCLYWCNLVKNNIC